MLSTPAILFSFLLAPQEPAPAPVLTVGDQSFSSWEAYLGSDLFRARGLRCGTRVDAPVQELRSPSDCSLGATTILPAYDPAGNPRYRIPVVVHVLQSTSGQGAIPDARILSQIEVLNEDFQALAGTLGQNGTDGGIEFFLATIDPLGNPTTGITRSVNDTWYADGGDYWSVLAWDPSRYLNIYTNTASGNLGYVPDLPQGGLVGESRDRVVVLHSAFGRNAPIGPPFDLGRTATHEVGHYFGLYHTFEGGCDTASCYTSGDRLCDTEPEAGPVFGCPASHVSCGTNDPFTSYMDYSDDGCYMEFTPEQVNRMRCTIVSWRPDLPTAAGCTASVATRTAGSNVNGYAVTSPVLGASFTMSVDAPGWTQAIVFSHAAPASQTYANGSVLLVDVLSTRYFQRTLSPLPGTAQQSLPANLALCGARAYTQALLLRSTPGFTFTNAVDLTLGF